MLDPEVLELLAQLQAQNDNVSNIPVAVSALNIDYLKGELYERGYRTRLAEDGKNFILVPIEQQRINQ